MQSFFRALKTYFAITFGFDEWYSQLSYAQFGEDLTINHFFSGRQKGFYVDIGAHHPYRYSNTFSLYQKGWSGLCVDPNPGTKNLFRRARPRDIVSEFAIGDSKKSANWMMFADSALNTFDLEHAQAVLTNKQSRKIGTKKVQVITATELLATFIPSGITHIDYLNIDTEGSDVSVLKGWPWLKWRPSLITVESDSSNTVEQYMQKQGYILRYQWQHTMGFVVGTL